VAGHRTGPGDEARRYPSPPPVAGLMASTPTRWSPPWCGGCRC